MDPANVTDRLGDLMRAAQDGDSRAYERLLTELVPLLCSVVRRQASWLQPADMEDVVQDILLSLHSVRETYDPARPFLPWLLAIARNRAIDGVRRQSRRAAHETLVEEYPETFSAAPANRNNDSYGDPEALRHAIGHLPPGQRRAIEMLKLRELSLKEAAAESGMSIAALKVAVHRGLGNLRRTLNDRGLRGGYEPVDP
jgi:RNA polymerase sigma factor (sigma-70 family)